ncbi:MAG: hypothetical protein IT494_09300 [Gammaproteobacteria bacterium]|nr:hypothetical protein [Gammaproteobacteria bacterium]
MMTRLPTTPCDLLTKLVLVLALQLPLPLAAQESTPPEQDLPIIIKPDKDNRVDSVRLANGQVRYRVTPLSGKPYCFVMEERKPFDPYSMGATYRVPCPKTSE